MLYRTGRTNANDGGIDFVMKPVGRFFQVTESLDFSKYFLDFEKVNRFPLTFIVKTEMNAEAVLGGVEEAARRTGRYSRDQIAEYLGLFEEVITLPDLRRLFATLPDEVPKLEQIKRELITQFELEYGLLD